VKHGNINMYDLQNLPAFVFLVKGITPHIFVGWDGLVSEEIQKRNNLSRGGNNRSSSDTLIPGASLQSESGQSDMENSGMSDMEMGSGSQSGSMSISGSIDDSGRDVFFFDGDGGSGGFGGDEQSLDDHDVGAAAGPGMLIRWPEQMTPGLRFLPIQFPQGGEQAQQEPQSGNRSLSQLLLSPSGPGFEQRVRGMNNNEVVRFAIQAGKQVVKLRQEKDLLKKKLKNSAQKSRRLGMRLQLSKDKYKSDKTSNQLVESLHVEKRGSRLTFRGSVALGVRKSMGLVSAASFPLTALIDSSRWTVTRAEVHSWALVIARSRAFHELLFLFLRYVHTRREQSVDSAAIPNEDTLVATSDVGASVFVLDGRVRSQDEAIAIDCGLPLPISAHQRDVFQSFNVGATFFSGDATNTSIWQRQKLQGLETSTSFLVSVDALSKGNMAGAFLRFRQMSLATG